MTAKCSRCGKEAEATEPAHNAGMLPKGWHDCFRILRFEPNFRRAMEKASLEEREAMPTCDECYQKIEWKGGAAK